MSRTRQLYRSRNALVGGVCAGIAERFDVDPLVVRILFLTFAVLTLGLAGLAYMVLWALLPKRPMQVKPVKVEPDSVHSDTFGAVDCRRARGAAMGRCANAVPYVGAAHLPPVPPAMAEKARCDQGPAMGLDAASVLAIIGVTGLIAGGLEAAANALISTPVILAVRKTMR